MSTPGTLALTASVQAFYNHVSELHEKEAMVRQELLHHVEVGNVTKFEKELLLQQNAERIVLLEKENSPTDKALQLKELLESIEPVPVTPGESKGWSKSGTKKKGRVSGGGVFSAMVVDSDDDDDDDDDDDTDTGEGEKEVNNDAATLAETGASSIKKKSKKKKKTKSKQEEVTSNQEEGNKEETALAQSDTVLQAYILPIVLAFVGWLVALLFGKPKKRGGQRR
jgi:hypothetical protein